MTAQTAHIFRHPIKAHGREELASVVLSAGGPMPLDRHWAVAHELSKFDPAAPAWTPCGHFQRGARTTAVMAITSRYDEATGLMQVQHPELPDLTFSPATEGPKFIEWLAPISPTERFRPTALVSAPGHAMTDTDYPSVSLMNLASNADLGRYMGMELSIHRWRANFWLEGLAPWAEMSWIGKRLRMGEALLEVRELVPRCRSTTADPATGRVEGDTLDALRKHIGQQDFGVIAVVLEGGAITRGSNVEVLS
ncbi:MOSC domain-containing protein [Xinfangfangia sp. CPCC 101601]|uniref:MOSC domain-containing protein n=1 Tax=Pseudogemmobacter lacusdianii TaxID=3069608 RepID=A0ABU0W0E8_9RHOB|nr:MOSC domain-containing protein [Xinfangfangia sp. CPCC 101601]MDQ2067489.1 MOSC domain-containing protein [Xinfangfangia sp. CPCC 101601]